jgi:hypothetical protein
VTTKSEELARLHERHAELTQALARITKAKRGTKWETDRLAERTNIQRQIERLEDLPPVPSYNPGSDPLYEGMEDEPEQPKPAPRASDGRRFEPSAADEAWRVQAAAAGMFRRPPTL